MRYRYHILLLLLLSQAFVYGQSSLSYTGGGSLGSLAYTSSTHLGCISLYGNPAGLTGLKSWGGDVGYARRFNLDELSTINISGAVKTSFGHFGITLSSFGSDAYSESKIGIAYARRLFSNLSIGVIFDRIQYDASKYGHSSIYTMDVGVMSHITSKLALGVYVFNPFSQKLNDITTLPTRFVTGIHYKANSKAGVMADFEKRTDRDVELKVAIYYHLIEQLRISVGGQLRNTAVNIGLSYRWNKYYTTTAVLLDNRIGNTPAISLGYIN